MDPLQTGPGQLNIPTELLYDLYNEVTAKQNALERREAQEKARADQQAVDFADPSAVERWLAQ